MFAKFRNYENSFFLRLLPLNRIGATAFKPTSLLVLRDEAFNTVVTLICHWNVVKCSSPATLISPRSEKRTTQVFHQNPLKMTRTQGTFFCNWTDCSLCNDWPFCPSSRGGKRGGRGGEREREGAMWLLRVLAAVTWHYVPLYWDVVIGGEEMKCLQAV